MTVIKLPSGRWQARLKVGREYAGTRTFDTKAQAAAWLARERAAAAGGVDPRAGRAPVGTLLPQWLEERQHTVAAKTYVADAAIARLTPKWFAVLQVRAVSDREVTRVLVALAKSGLAETSVRRYRASLSSFFAWAVRERLIASNPVTVTRTPKGHDPRTEMQPFSEDELFAFVERVRKFDDRLADVLLVAGWTGLRWSELREVRVRDLTEVPVPGLLVRRAAPEGVRVKTTKSAKSRRVPLTDVVLPVVRACATGKSGGELLFTTEGGARLHASWVKRKVRWAAIAQGRRIHDLRHTAACLWLSRGVDPVTVQAWMGHSSMATTNLYLHYLGSAADVVALDRLNTRGYSGGTGAGAGS
ncbi:MAG TPA: site-specific integrase [Dermatophilaceae bacterium]|nr:site-specific integrase [Dermatophilaceae bacterium]